MGLFNRKKKDDETNGMPADGSVAADTERPIGAHEQWPPPASAPLPDFAAIAATDIEDELVLDVDYDQTPVAEHEGDATSLDLPVDFPDVTSEEPGPDVPADYGWLYGQEAAAPVADVLAGNAGEFTDGFAEGFGTEFVEHDPAFSYAPPVDFLVPEAAVDAQVRLSPDAFQYDGQYDGQYDAASSTEEAFEEFVPAPAEPDAYLFDTPVPIGPTSGSGFESPAKFPVEFGTVAETLHQADVVFDAPYADEPAQDAADASLQVDTTFYDVAPVEQPVSSPEAPEAFQVLSQTPDEVADQGALVSNWPIEPPLPEAAAPVFEEPALADSDEPAYTAAPVEPVESVESVEADLAPADIVAGVPAEPEPEPEPVRVEFTPRPAFHHDVDEHTFSPLLAGLGTCHACARVAYVCEACGDCSRCCEYAVAHTPA